MTSKVFEYRLEGLSFDVYVTETDGVYSAQIKMISGHADINSIYWSDGDAKANEGSFTNLTGGTKLDSSVNMNGATYDGGTVLWDAAQQTSKTGLAGEDKPTYLTAGETLDITLKGVTSFSQVELLGIRATSTSTPEGSIKAVDKGEFPPPPAPKDDFPDRPQDISYVALVFDQTKGDIAPDTKLVDPDGYYTVKIDGWMDKAVLGGDDLDDYIDDILEYLSKNDPNFTSADNLLGAVIKGGTASTSPAEYYAYGDNNLNGSDPDVLPSNIGFTVDDQQGITPANAIDQSFQYNDIFIFV